MVAVTGHIGVLRDMTVEIEAVDYANQLTRARLVPDTPEQVLRTLVPDGAISDTDSSVWTFELAGVQKTAAGGLLKLLNESAPGALLDVEFIPKNGTGNATYTFTVSAKPVPIGGDQGNQATFEVVLAVQGSPVPGTVS